MTHLDSDSDAFFAAMREQIQATPMPTARARPPRHRAVRPRIRRRLELLGAAGILVAGVIAAVVLLFSALASPPPALALTRNSDGTITVTLNELSKGVSALNAEFARLHIDETAIPVLPTCRSSAGPSFPSGPRHLTSGGMSVVFTHSITFNASWDRQHRAPRGYKYIVAAKRLPNGQIVEFVGSIATPLPSCFAP